MTPHTVPRILITGSRSWVDYDRLRAILDYHQQAFPAAILVHGAARGVDRAAARIWTGWGLPTEAHPVTAAEWHASRGAGHARNAHMVQAGAALCLAFIRDGSPGATACAALAEKAGIPTYRHYETSRP
jgi:hypothetical protein